MDDVQHRLTGRRSSFFCTAQGVREAITISLMGMRTKLRAREAKTIGGQEKLKRRCVEIREQLRLLLRKGKKRHVQTALRILRMYEEILDEEPKPALQSDHAPPDPPSP